MEQHNTDHELDLPLFSNIDDIHVRHYVLDLTCCEATRNFVGSVTLICDIINHNNKPSGKKRCIRNDSPNKISNEKSCGQCQSNPICDNVDARNSFKVRDHNYCVQLPTQDAAETQDNELSSSKSDELLNKVNDKLTNESDDIFVILDAWDLDIESVYKLVPNGDETFSDIESDKIKLKKTLNDYMVEVVKFHSEKKCLKIWIPDNTGDTKFPLIIRISYKTLALGPSLKWTKDQDGRACVYTHGHWVNNRSLFPSQDVPGALATWSAHISVSDDQIVLMSGDFNAIVESVSPGCKTFFYQTEMEVPSSTLALAVGHWTCTEIISVSRFLENSKMLPCRLFSPHCHLELAESLLCSFIPRCMAAVYDLLGPHPFRRLDILIVPSSFASLGMASPSFMFLSQAVLSEDGHMLVRVAHEMSHSWFGLVIGPQDWHEEWLSEGFCTYTEAILHAKANKVPVEEFRLEQEIYDSLKYNTLQAELQSVDDELQTLRKTSDINSVNNSSGTKYVVNGINPDKGFLQVHYVKGYFLLRYLEKKVDEHCPDKFYDFLKHFVSSFKHKLVDTMDVLALFFEMYPELRTVDFCEDTIVKCWLNSPGLPEVLTTPIMNTNVIAKQVFGLEEKISEQNQTLLKMHWRKRQKVDVHALLDIPQLKVVQVLLLLDLLLRHKKIHHSILSVLNMKLDLSSSNADVRHKWCELVVKHRLSNHYSDVYIFLENYQAMGVYLYGELVISKDKDQHKLAQSCFQNVAEEMEDGVRNVVKVMLYGS